MNTFCDDFEWRLNISPNDLIDSADHACVWYNSTVIEKRIIEENSRTIIEILIG